MFVSPARLGIPGPSGNVFLIYQSIGRPWPDGTNCAAKVGLCWDVTKKMGKKMRGVGQKMP